MKFGTIGPVVSEKLFEIVDRRRSLPLLSATPELSAQMS